jgi:hypothetical protein
VDLADEEVDGVFPRYFIEWFGVRGAFGHWGDLLGAVGLGVDD